MTASLPRRLAAEGLGTAALLAVVVGSGIMGERLAGGNAALALLANSLATGCGLAVLILVLAPVSGAHFNPVVTLLSVAQGGIAKLDGAGYVLMQVAGAVAGVVVAHLMFDLAPLQASTHARTGAAQWLAEFVATFGLVAVILGCAKRGHGVTSLAVAAYITAAYWFTASTAFANPAVTLARSFTATFSGIRREDVAAFAAAQLAGGLAAFVVMRWMLRPGPARGR